MYNSFIKILLDLTLSFVLLLLSLPILILCSILLFISNQGQVFFFQPRPGKNGEIFTIIKFKTMTDSKDNSGNFLPDNQRLTVIGKWIRKLSIDELPQIINVLKGDMSLIGPRPLLKEYLPLYNSKQKRRHEVKPGITGWAQVNGRNAISWEEKFDMDVWYVDNVTFLLDIKIFFLTIAKILKKEGISSLGMETTHKFNGNN